MSFHALAIVTCLAALLLGAGWLYNQSAAGALQSWPAWAGCFVRFAIA